MAVRSAISVGFPGGNYVAELGKRDAALPGEFIIEAGHAIVTVVAGQIGNLTLAATAKVVVSASAAPAIGNLSLAAVGNIAITATVTRPIDDLTLSATAVVPDGLALNATIDGLTLSATGGPVVSAALDAAIDPVTLDAAGIVAPAPARAGGGGPAWWWHEYVRNRLAERAAEREKKRRLADLYATLPSPYGAAYCEHEAPARGLAARLLPPVVAGRFTVVAELENEALALTAAIITLAEARPHRLVAAIEHDGPIADDEAATLAAATLLLAA